MSEKILEALMQLFAIISNLISSATERESIVRSFLERELNKELSKKYLGIYLDFSDVVEGKLKKKALKNGKIPVSLSVRAVKLCEDIIGELTQQQKIVVLIQLIEFIKSDSMISDDIKDFMDTISSTFNVENEEYISIKEFVLNDKELPPSKNYLFIDETKKGDGQAGKEKHIYRKNINGQVRVIYIQSTNLYFVKYLGKAEIYINGQILDSNKTYPLNTGSSIRNKQIKPIYYSDIVQSFFEDRIKSKIVFKADQIGFTFPNGATGLHDMTFTETSGRLVGIMGASGAGKSTLLNVLNGTNAPTRGKVLINDIDINSNDPAIEGIIGFVSQDDLLIEELSVYQNLYYNAKLCFENYSEEQLEETVNNVLRNLGLFEIRNIQVGSPLNKKISGGQRKRLNIALELIREPAVLFLDEPTSGLSSRDSENILDLLKELSLKGKLVFVVIHQPSSDIFKMFDRLLILDTGGYLIYNGNPIDSIQYFKTKVNLPDKDENECPTCGNVNPEQVFNIVERSVLDEYGKLTHTRRISPQEWSEHYRQEHKEAKEPKASKEDLPEISFKTPGKFKQFLIFLKRDILKKISDTQYMVINFLEAPLLAFLLAFIVKYYNVSVTNKFEYTLSDNSNLPVYIFMSVIVAIFMGLSVSAEEIIKDKKILKREAFLNLSWSGYLLSKVAVQFMLAAIQSLTFILIGNSIMEIKGMYFEYWLVLFSAWAAANMMGLLISDSFKTVVTIYILIPFLVIPQIILSGIIVKFEKLNPTISSPERIPFYGEVITARWAYEALATYQFTNNAYEKNFYLAEKKMSVADFKSNFLIQNLQNKLNLLSTNYTDPEQQVQMQNYLELIINELDKERASRDVLREYCEGVPNYRLSVLEDLNLEKLNPEVLEQIASYLKELSKDYTTIYRDSYREVDQLKRTFNLGELQEMNRKHHNESLEKFVTNKDDFDRIIEYKGKLIQKTNPIYLDPTSPFIKAHFYAPRKMIFGHFIPTLWVNVIVIWLMTFIFYILLYFRVLKRTMDYFENFSRKRNSH